MSGETDSLTAAQRRHEVVWRSLTRVARFDVTVVVGDLAEALWTEPGAVVASGEVLQAKGVRRTVRITWGGQPYVLKYYADPTWRHTLKQYVQHSRAARTWAVTHQLADGRILTPRPVAYIENRWGPFRRDSFLVYPYVEGTSLKSLLADAAATSQPLSDGVWKQLHELWQRLTQLQASIADANAGNFIVSPDGQLWIIDLDKARFHRRASVAARWRKHARAQIARWAGKQQLKAATQPLID